nr:hypothetical protein [Desulfobacteraceae bacterium]
MKQNLFLYQNTLPARHSVFFIFCLILFFSPFACGIIPSDNTQLINVIASGDGNAAQKTIRSTADVNYITDTDTYPLLEASVAGNLELTKLLLENGAD